MFNQKHLTLLQQLVSCRSITPVDDNAMSILVEYLEKLGFTVQSMIINDIINIYAKINHSTNKNLCFLGHTDVVPPGEGWIFDPFCGNVINNNVYGRGTVDMKGAIVCFIAAVEKFLSLYNNFDESISILLTGDEEGRAEYGVKAILPYISNENITHAIAGEPTAQNIIGDVIKIGSRGSVTFVLEIYGIQGHVAYHDCAKNPITTAITIMEVLINYKFINYDDFAETHLEITKFISDSGAENMVPGQAIIQFNIRFGLHYTVDDLKIIIINILNNYLDSKEYKLSHWSSGNAYLGTAKNSNFITFLTDILAEYNIAPDISTQGGTSDARFVRNICEVVEFGLKRHAAHQVNEAVPLDDLYRLSEIYFSIIQKYFYENCKENS